MFLNCKLILILITPNAHSLITKMTIPIKIKVSISGVNGVSPLAISLKDAPTVMVKKASIMMPKKMIVFSKFRLFFLVGIINKINPTKGQRTNYKGSK